MTTQRGARTLGRRAIRPRLSRRLAERGAHVTAGREAEARLEAGGRTAVEETVVPLETAVVPLEVVVVQQEVEEDKAVWRRTTL